MLPQPAGRMQILNIRSGRVAEVPGRNSHIFCRGFWRRRYRKGSGPAEIQLLAEPVPRAVLPSARTYAARTQTLCSKINTVCRTFREGEPANEFYLIRQGTVAFEL